MSLSSKKKRQHLRRQLRELREAWRAEGFEDEGSLNEAIARVCAASKPAPFDWFKDQLPFKGSVGGTTRTFGGSAWPPMPKSYSTQEIDYAALEERLFNQLNQQSRLVELADGRAKKPDLHKHLRQWRRRVP